MNEKMAVSLDRFKQAIEENLAGELLWDLFLELFVATGLLEFVDIEWCRRDVEHLTGAVRLRGSDLTLSNDYCRFDLYDCIQFDNGRLVMLPHVAAYPFYPLDYKFSVVDGKIIADHVNPEVDDSFTLHTDGHKLNRALVA